MPASDSVLGIRRLPSGEDVGSVADCGLWLAGWGPALPAFAMTPKQPPGAAWPQLPRVSLIQGDPQKALSLSTWPITLDT